MKSRGSSKSRSDLRIVAGIGLCALDLTGAAWGKPPPLPTPCIAGNCGTSATSFVAYGSAGATVNGATMTVTQSSLTAILNWADFNIANGYKVNFVQPSATAQILNNIWSGNPSVIAGALNANGQVYLYNQNGIVFDKGAQVNVGGLTASTLNFTPVGGDPDGLFKNGILSGNSTIVSTGILPAAFQAIGGNAGTIAVNSGATLTATDGGRILLLGSAVSNAGTITSPDGQTILGAGNTIYLAASTDPALRGLLIEVGANGGHGTVVDAATNLPVEIGTVSNTGQISAPRGNVSLAGLTVNQAGMVSATTSVSANGSIFLVAGDTSATDQNGSQEVFYNTSAAGFGALLPNQGGTLTLAPGSTTEILPDTSAATITAANINNFIPSHIALVGETVAAQSSSTVRAPGGSVEIDAASNPAQQLATPNLAFNDGGRIYLDSGSDIDVSGLTNVEVAATQNVIQVKLEGNDLQDDPLLRTGFLHGQTVTVNLAVTPTVSLFDVSPYAGNIALGIDQVLTKGGSIKLNSNGDVIARAGSTLNVSGGSIAYQGAYGPSTTSLVASSGVVYNIGNAPATLNYTGVANGYGYTDPTWGTQTTLSPQTYYPGYIQGANAGAVTVLGSEVYLRGSLLGGTVSGIYQRSAPPEGGQFVLGCACILAGTSSTPDLRAPGVLLANGATDTLGDHFNYLDSSVALPAALQSVTTVSPAQLNQGGFNQVTIFSNGPVTLPAGTSVNLAVGGSFKVTTDQSIDIAGNVQAPSATIALVTEKNGSEDLTAHDITLGPDAVLDASGEWVNDSPLINSSPPTAATVTAGGKISLSAAGDLSIGAGSHIDVSGGAWLKSSGKLSVGNAGSIVLSASYAPVANGAYTGTIDFGAGATLAGASLSAGKGGSLSLQAGSVTVGDTLAGTPGELLLKPSFFANQGFQQYGITGQNDVLIGSPSSAGTTDAVVIAPSEENLAFTHPFQLEPTGTPLQSFSALASLPEAQRAPVSIAFSATSTAVAPGPGVANDGNLTLAQNATISTDPGGSVKLAAAGLTGDVTILGTVDVPAGTISVSIATPTTVGSTADPGYLADQEILLGPQAVLSAPAYAAINTLDPQGYRQGAVLAGGTISVVANKGYVLTDPGSLITVHGASGTLDVSGPTGVVPTEVNGSAGNIILGGREGLVIDGTLDGHAATAADGSPLSGASGGTLIVNFGGQSLSSPGAFLFDYQTTVANNVNLQNPYPLTPRVLTLTDQPASALPVGLQSGVAQLSAGTVQSGGFDNVSLASADIIALSGNLNLSTRATLTLDAPVLQGVVGSTAHLSSAYVALGNYSNNGDYFDNVNGSANPTAGLVLAPGCGTTGCGASLSVSAQLIDVRGISAMAGFASTYLTSSGDIRLTVAENPVNTPPSLLTQSGDTSIASLRAGLQLDGTLRLTAAQIYPTTNTDFTLTDTSPAGSAAVTPAAVTIAPAAAASTTPLSAGGILTINAPSITQEGALRAPLGQINLNGLDTVDGSTGLAVPGVVNLSPGSLTSVSAGGLLIPYGSTVNGTQWTYTPNSTTTEVIAAPPSKTVSLSGSNVAIGGTNSSVGKTSVDLSGGGDLYAYEWIAGPGGSTDVLSPTSTANHAGLNPYQYAIVPSLGAAFAPVDAQYQLGTATSVSGQSLYNRSIYLSGVPGLPAGTYTLLPARYALLPGAYALQITPDTNLVAGSAIAQSSGAYVVSGRLGIVGTNVVDSQTSTVLIASSAVVNTQSQFTSSYGNAFFSAAASAGGTATPRLPADAGELQIAATNTLTLAASINFVPGTFVSTNATSGATTTVQGAGGIVSIEAPSILVADAATPAGAGTVAGAVRLSAESLDSLGAQTVLLGATEQNGATGEQINVGPTQSIEFDNASVALTAPQLVAAAQAQVLLDSGAQVKATGAQNQSQSALVLNGGGALLFASSGATAPLTINSSVAGGELSVGSQASLHATGDLILYSSGTTSADPTASIGAPSLGLYSSRVSLGDVPTGAEAPNGLNLTNPLLGQLRGLQNLTIGSTTSIDLYGAVVLGTPGSTNPSLASVTLDAWAINGYGAGAKTLEANSITISNSNAGALPANLFVSTPDGTGALTIAAVNPASGVKDVPGNSGEIFLGAGTKALAGFSTVNLNAASQVQMQGSGSLTIGATAPVDLSVQSGVVTAAALSNQTITTLGNVTISGTSGAAANPTSVPVGGRLVIQGGAIAQNGTIDLPSGILNLSATSGDVTLGAHSVTSVAGALTSFGTASAAAPGGLITLASMQGNVSVASGAKVDVAGTASADGKTVGDAGSLAVSAPLGTYAFADGTLSGLASPGAQGGNFSLDVATGLGGSGFSSLNALLSAAGFTGNLDLRDRNDADVTVASGDRVQASSFSLAADQGTINLAGTIDTSVRGTGSSNGGAAGSISVWAGNNLNVEAGANLLANAGAASGPTGINGTALAVSGGDITLGAARGTISIDGGSAQLPTIISTTGSAGAASDGTVTFRAPRTPDDTGVQIQIQNAGNLQIGTRLPLVIEGVKTYSASDLGGVDGACGAVGSSCDVGDMNGVLFSDAATFVRNAGPIIAGLGLGSQSVQVRPGIEIDSTGDLVLDNTTNPAGVWDLNSWNAALEASGTPGPAAVGPINLTLRAAGNLAFQASLSDGFTAKGTNLGNWTFGESGSVPDSSNYRLTAGSDLGAANPLAVIAQPLATVTQTLSNGVSRAIPNSGNVIVDPGSLIRTGNGNIDVAAGGDVLLGYTAAYDANNNLQLTTVAPLSSVIYTAGTPVTLTAAQAALFTAPKNSLYGENGGDITINAAHDIVSAPSAEFVSDWLWRRGQTNADGTLAGIGKNTTWWVVPADFAQGIGVLGGGNLTLSAGDNITNVSAVIPTTGQLLGAAGTLPQLSNLLVYGGGALRVQAGGNIESGVFENDWGNSSLRAGGAVTSGAQLQDVIPGIAQADLGSIPITSPVYPVIVVGTGSFNIAARDGVTLGLVAGAESLPASATNSAATKGGTVYWYDYDAASALNIESTGGNVVLGANSGNLPLVLLNNNNTSVPATYDGASFVPVYPPTVSVAALGGDVQAPSEVDLFPAASGNLALLANGSISSGPTTGAPSLTLTMFESNPALWPGTLTPLGSAPNPDLVGFAASPNVPLHQTDAQPIEIVANTGNITNGVFNFPKAANVIAGGNIVDLDYVGKNLNPSDATLIQAGGAVTYSTPTDPVTNDLLPNPIGISVGGTGFLDVIAGGSINLGDSNGIVTSGNLNDSRLASQGATVVVAAGLGNNSDGSLRTPSYQPFINTYLAPTSNGTPGAYAANVVAYMQQLFPGQTAESAYPAALAGFEALTRAQQLPLIAQVLSDELSETGLAHSISGATYDRGYTAINTLFPAMANNAALVYQGDINMFFSQVKTEQGGDINLLDPGGSVVVGVPNPPAALTTVKQTSQVSAAANLGILVLGPGAIQGFANENFEVNQSRILTLEGGNIILWASNGNIDAGRGAKSASAAPPPVIQTDANGNVFVNPVNDVTGSGIGQLLSGPGETAGLVNLIAPKGDVNAGDAGIRVAGNLNIAAVQFIGAGNTVVAGTSTGVPASEAGAFAGALSGANSLGDASKSAVDQLSQDLGNSANYQQLSDSLTTNYIVVKMFCIGIECEQR